LVEVLKVFHEGMMIQRWLRTAGLIVAGFVVGGGLGLYLGWVAWPT
jgi:hypothetical protein